MQWPRRHLTLDGWPLPWSRARDRVDPQRRRVLNFGARMTRRSTPGTRSVRAGKGERGGVRSLWRAELARGLMLARTNDAEGARAAFARAHALAPDEAQPAYSLARAEQRRGRVLEAERLLRVAL